MNCRATSFRFRRWQCEGPNVRCRDACKEQAHPVRLAIYNRADWPRTPQNVSTAATLATATARACHAIGTKIAPRSKPATARGGLAMAQVDEIRRLVSASRSRITEDRAMLQRMARELSYTDQVIERATLAYNVSLWTLEKFERSQSNSRLNNPPRARE